MTTVITQLARLDRHVRLAVLALCVLGACQTSPASAPAAAKDAGDNSRAMDAAGERVTGEPPLPGFCARAGSDAVRELFCTPVQPTIRGVRDLEILLGFFSPEAEAREGPAAAGGVDNGDRHITAALGHSTALSGQLVSPLNPRLIILGAETIMAFQRGVQRIELISRARDTGTFNFYLVDFEQACNQGNACSFGDLYTPQVETNWLRVAVRDGEDLVNTPQDCRACHQRGLEAPTLLMRELLNPWTHFFVQAGATLDMPGVTGSDLLADYLKAKGDEGYGGIALATISSTSPFVLQSRVGPVQPLVFDAPTIFNERYPYGPDGYASEARPSPTWQRAYEAFKRGEQLASPYLEQRASDQEKQAKLSEAYQRYRAGAIRADELPDLADIFPDDPRVRAQIGLQTEPDASAEETLIQACGSCHNDVLDQSLSRARFNIAVSRLDRAELALAVERIELAPTTPGAMPPSDARQLDPSARARLLDYLRQDPSSLQADSRLERAAQLGMAGGRTVTE
jgi:hypothetical protein